MMRKLTCIALAGLMGLPAFGGFFVLYSCPLTGDAGVAVYTGAAACYSDEAAAARNLPSDSERALVPVCDVTVMQSAATLVSVPGHDPISMHIAGIHFQQAYISHQSDGPLAAPVPITCSGARARNCPLLI